MWYADFSSNDRQEVTPLIGLNDEDMDSNTMITTYHTAVTDAASEKLGKDVAEKSRGPPKMFSTFVVKEEI